jgi:hypothetical protein
LSRFIRLAPFPPIIHVLILYQALSDRVVRKRQNVLLDQTWTLGMLWAG